MLIQPTTPTPTGPQADDPIIDAGAFWPSVDPVAARQAMRLDGTVTPQRLRGALVEAIVSVGSQLADWRRRQQDVGFATLADLPADDIDGASVLVQRWHRAVQCMAAANLTERYRSFDSTAAGNKQADELDTTVDDLRRDAHWAISDILGVGRSTIELI